MSMLEVSGVVKRFGGLAALNGVELSVRGGELVGIIGPNGAGKTTLVNVVMGVYYPDSGRITFDGRDITRMPPHRRARMGLSRTYQVPRPFNDLKVIDNVAVAAMYGSKDLPVGEAREIAEDLLRRVRLAERAEDYPESLSVVELRKLELARALAQEAKLVFLDEVSAGLVGEDLREVLSVVRELHEGGMTIVMIEHVMKVIFNLAERIVVMMNGQKLAEGTPSEVSSDARVVESYLGKRWSEV
ncbi:ABC transporter ATP-binding protein [Conexivisphaera calida]|uniref:Branched-chain amino acid transport ATP-binding protein LivG n=1 Tax=Conexivisphaera calida TaxID=1874277 RepID=A0A4P2VDA8_9ARCH|nr:ABC transporter ATP-binding protein [Conexivisphaera calida]BBE42534.1 Branched-chain amino acid transport ATP-binding protein LivG [Conexivisphaera calida]